jgi:hypothetical protein
MAFLSYVHHKSATLFPRTPILILASPPFHGPLYAFCLY